MMKLVGDVCVAGCDYVILATAWNRGGQCEMLCVTIAVITYY